MAKIFILCVLCIFCGCMTKRTVQPLNNKGLVLDVKLEKDSVACGDSVMMSFIISNPTDSPVVIDSLQRILLERYNKTETFGDVYDSCICQGIGDTMILPHSQYMKNVKVHIKPEFFFIGLNNIRAHFLCSLLIYEERSKKYLYIPKNGVIVYSIPFTLCVVDITEKH